MRDQYMTSGQGFILTYSITSKCSYDEIAVFKEQVLRVKDTDQVPMVICGNKCDLENERQISKDDGKRLGRCWGCPFYETSARERINIENVFFDLVREIRKDIQRTQPTIKKKKKKTCQLL
eukprot:TRINITY_DN15669_c0_g1_i1.p1 TRINITY_DN15669_c0_g1~~TRINITY_DN15669_c0_g1_i1.p1  ORF type:complete len:121 (+),score=22.53 TRINITY_DN15669_c0_g1_i1:111-473(+)